MSNTILSIRVATTMADILASTITSVVRFNDWQHEAQTYTVITYGTPSVSIPSTSLRVYCSIDEHEAMVATWLARDRSPLVASPPSQGAGFRGVLSIPSIRSILSIRTTDNTVDIRASLITSISLLHGDPLRTVIAYGSSPGQSLTIRSSPEMHEALLGAWQAALDGA